MKLFRTLATWNFVDIYQVNQSYCVPVFKILPRRRSFSINFTTISWVVPCWLVSEIFCLVLKMVEQTRACTKISLYLNTRFFLWSYVKIWHENSSQMFWIRRYLTPMIYFSWKYQLFKYLQTYTGWFRSCSPLVEGRRRMLKGRSLTQEVFKIQGVLPNWLEISFFPYRTVHQIFMKFGRYNDYFVFMIRQKVAIKTQDRIEKVRLLNKIVHGIWKIVIIYFIL